MALSWNEITARAIQFSKEWKDEKSEDAEAKSFWDDFFNVFGISRRRYATFETKVTKNDRKDGYIDLLWKGHLLVEHKSSGKDLDRAYKQAIEYFPGLKESDLPKYVLVCNFQDFRLYDLDEDKQHQFSIEDFPKNVHLFDFIAGYQKRTFKEEDPVNIQAAELMGLLHDKLSEIGYTGHHLELYLVRLLFCLFADDTSIFEKGIFHEYIDQRTNEDGSDLAIHLSQIFEILNTPKQNRLKNLDETLATLPYVNGKLFEERLPSAYFDKGMREALLKCCHLNWGMISPAIFGSLFQSVMNPKERRNLGAHYTSEKNILKLIKPLFLDDLWSEFDIVKSSKNKLQKFHDKISELRFLDPACGCGNFLVITYRELRLLEIEIIKILQKGQLVTDVSNLIKLDVDRFYGVECEEFPAQIAQVAMWLIDHQMNMKFSNILGEYYIRLPLRKSPVIINRNSLTFDWHTLIDPIPWEKKIQRFDYIFGNPPFVGKHLQNSNQKADMSLLWHGVNGSGVLDYVACWYIKAAQYLSTYSPTEDNTSQAKTKVAFVSTNSITQGEQIGILWNELLNKYKIKIHFAHRTFKWSNEARGKAAVHVVIIGFSNYDAVDKYLYEYDNVKGDPHLLKVKNINPYLVEGQDFYLSRRNNPINSVPTLLWGSKPVDDGNLILSQSEYEYLLKKYPILQNFIRQYVGADELLYGTRRYCLWLRDINPSLIKNIPEVADRIEKVKIFRAKSKKEATREMAHFPSLFAEIREPIGDFLIIPEVSSENRSYLPIGFGNKKMIISNRNYMLQNASLYHFGVLSSKIHHVWTMQVCGRLESRITYSSGIVYNNFPWPINPMKKQVTEVERSAQNVIDVRKAFSQNSLSELYDPLSMPPSLVKAHQDLDRAVDKAYRPQPFPSDTKRIEFLFALYNNYIGGLFQKNRKQ